MKTVPAHILLILQRIPLHVVLVCLFLSGCGHAAKHHVSEDTVQYRVIMREEWFSGAKYKSRRFLKLYPDSSYRDEVRARLEYLEAIENEDAQLMRAYVLHHPGSTQAARLDDLLTLGALRESGDIEAISDFLDAHPGGEFADEAGYLLACLQALEINDVKVSLAFLAGYYVPTYNAYEGGGIDGLIRLAHKKNSTSQRIADRTRVHEALRAFIRKTDRALYSSMQHLDDHNVVTRYRALRDIDDMEKTRLTAAIPELVDLLQDQRGVDVSLYSNGRQTSIRRDTPSSLAGKILGEIGGEALPLVLAHIAYNADLLARYHSGYEVRGHLKVVNIIGDRSAIPVLSDLYAAEDGRGGVAFDARDIIRRIEAREGVASGDAWRPPARNKR
jgi:hypothetical protein